MKRIISLAIAAAFSTSVSAAELPVIGTLPVVGDLPVTNVLPVIGNGNLPVLGTPVPSLDDLPLLGGGALPGGGVLPDLGNLPILGSTAGDPLNLEGVLSMGDAVTPLVGELVGAGLGTISQTMGALPPVPALPLPATPALDTVTGLLP